MLEGFEPIHYAAYSVFFMGKIMFVVSVGALYSGYDNPLPFAMAYVGFVLISFVLGMYDQWRTVGFGVHHYSISSNLLAPMRKHIYKIALDPVRGKDGQ